MTTIIPADIENYVTGHTTDVPVLMQHVIEQTQQQLTGSQMLSGRLVGQLLRLLVSCSKAKRVLELGTYSGFSALMMAQALPDDGELVTIEASAESYQLAQQFFKKSADSHKIKAINGKIFDLLPTLAGSFDLIFIDADKKPIQQYYQWAVDHVRSQGLIVIDNVLWHGKVLAPDEDEYARVMHELNEAVQSDSRVSNLLLPVRDGVMVIQKA